MEEEQDDGYGEELTNGRKPHSCKGSRTDFKRIRTGLINGGYKAYIYDKNGKLYYRTDGVPLLRQHPDKPVTHRLLGTISMI